MNEKKWRLGRGPASFGASFIFDFFQGVRVKVKMEE